MTERGYRGNGGALAASQKITHAHVDMREEVTCCPLPGEDSYVKSGSVCIVQTDALRLLLRLLRKTSLAGEL